MTSKRYRLIDIAHAVGRDKSTIIHWEELKLIPHAHRDSRGWRYYTEAEADTIITSARNTNYFKKEIAGTHRNGTNVIYAQGTA